MRRLRLTDTHHATIRVALICSFNQAMEHLDMMTPPTAGFDPTGFWLQQAGKSWDAYKAIAGIPINPPVAP